MQDVKKTISFLEKNIQKIQFIQVEFKTYRMGEYTLYSASATEGVKNKEDYINYYKRILSHLKLNIADIRKITY